MVRSPSTIKRFFRRTAEKVAGAWKSILGDEEDSTVSSPDLEERDGRKVLDLMQRCLTSRNETTCRRTAARIGSAYKQLNDTGKKRFQLMLVEHFNHDLDRIRDSVDRFEQHPSDPDAYRQLLKSTSSPRIELLKQLNALPDGFMFLVELREDCLNMMEDEPTLGLLNLDLKLLFNFWFDVNLLKFERITWDSPASLLEKLIHYEDVHRIADWEDLKDRLDQDRRCYALLHPKMPNEPLIFVQVALTNQTTGRIPQLLDPSAPVLDPGETDTAVFYSISNSQEGLRGISFGPFLLKEVIDDLGRDLPQLENYVTLSPVPRFRSWLITVLETEPDLLSEAFDNRMDRERITSLVEDPSPDELEPFEEPLMKLCSFYLMRARREDGLPEPPVARFHLRNGARIERINWMGNPSEEGLRESLGIMVNYRYVPDEIEENHRLLMEENRIQADSRIRKRAEQFGTAPEPI